MGSKSEMKPGRSTRGHPWVGEFGIRKLWDVVREARAPLATQEHGRAEVALQLDSSQVALGLQPGHSGPEAFL